MYGLLSGNHTLKPSASAYNIMYATKSANLYFPHHRWVKELRSDKFYLISIRDIHLQLYEHKQLQSTIITLY